MYSIQLENLKLGFSHQLIFEHFNLTVNQGEFIGIFGPNGAGKTSFLQLILGLIPPLHGSVMVCNRPVERGNPDIGYLPQLHRDLESFPLSARSFLEAAAQGIGWGMPFVNKYQKHQIQDVIDLLSLDDLMDRPFKQLSGGERQRLFLACALLGNPKILLLDEPLNNLDPIQNALMIELIHQLNTQLKITVLLTSHHIEPLLSAMDRIILIAQSKAILMDVDQFDEKIFKNLYQNHSPYYGGHHP